MNNVKKTAQHLKEYLLVYTLISLAIGLTIGYEYSEFFKTNREIVKNIIIFLAILTIYPSMIQLKVERLGKAAKKLRQVTLAMLFIFILAPILAITFARFISDQQIGLGYVASNVVPASSASIGYVLMAEGNIELATVLAILSLVGALIAVPTYLSFYASITSIPLPMDKIIQSIIYTLITPFILGQITRYYVIKHRAKNRINDAKNGKPTQHNCLIALEKGTIREREHKLAQCVEKDLERSIKPHLSLLTITSMLILILVLVANKASLLILNPKIATEIIGFQVLMLIVLLGLITILNKIIRVNYEDHAAISFISATKNQSVAAAIAVIALGTKAALAPALIPAIQAPIAITYLQIIPKLKNTLSKHK